MENFKSGHVRISHRLCEVESQPKDFFIQYITHTLQQILVFMQLPTNLLVELTPSSHVLNLLLQDVY